MSEFEFRTTADADEFATAIWESVGGGVDDKIDDQAWDAVSTQVSEAINNEAWDVVRNDVYDVARDAVEEYSGSVDGVEQTLSDLLRQYNEVSVGSHCTIGERATALVTKVIQWHLDTSADEGGLLSSQASTSLYTALASKVETLSDAASYWAGTRRVVELEDKVAGLAEENALLWVKVNDLTGMVSRLLAESHGFRPKYDTPEGTLAQAESTLKHILIAVQDKREAVRIAEPF